MKKKKINFLLLFTLLLGTQHSINAAYGGGLAETDEERFERELAQAVACSEQEYYRTINDALTENELAQIAEAEAIANTERLRQLQIEEAILAEVLTASKIGHGGAAASGNKESIAEEFARVAAERHDRVTKKLGQQGGFLAPGEKPTIGVKPQIKIKKKIISDTGFPPPPDEEWLKELHRDGGDHGASTVPKKKPSTTRSDTEGLTSELNAQWNKMFGDKKKK